MGRFRASLRLLPTLLTLLLAACGRPPQAIVLSGPTEGTTWHLTVAPEGEGPDAGQLRAIVETALSEVDDALSAYSDSAALARFNASEQTEWVEVPAPLATVVSESLRIGVETGGAFDITVAPLVELWGFGTGSPRLEPPSEQEIAAAQARVGQQHLAVRLDPPALRKDLPDLRLDVDAIAPGYAVDLVAGRLDDAGIHRYMIEVGGEVRVRGRNATGQPWRIGIECPDESGRSVVRVLRLEAGAVSTSGDYRDYFEANGRRYSHTLDPRSGRPVTHSLASVTVLRPTTMEADGLATALSVLGPDEGFDLAEQKGWAALFISRQDDGFRQRETTAFAKILQAGQSTP